MLSFECIKNEKSVYFLLTSAKCVLLRNFHFSNLIQWVEYKFLFSSAQKNRN